MSEVSVTQTLLDNVTIETKKVQTTTEPTVVEDRLITTLVDLNTTTVRNKNKAIVKPSWGEIWNVYFASIEGFIIIHSVQDQVSKYILEVHHDGQEVRIWTLVKTV